MITQNSAMGDEELRDRLVKLSVDGRYIIQLGEDAEKTIGTVVELIKSRDQQIALAARLDEQINTTADTNGNVWFRKSIEPHKAITQLERVNELLADTGQAQNKEK